MKLPAIEVFKGLDFHTIRPQGTEGIKVWTDDELTEIAKRCNCHEALAAACEASWEMLSGALRCLDAYNRSQYDKVMPMLNDALAEARKGA